MMIVQVFGSLISAEMFKMQKMQKDWKWNRKPMFFFHPELRGIQFYDPSYITLKLSKCSCRNICTFARTEFGKIYFQAVRRKDA